MNLPRLIWEYSRGVRIASSEGWLRPLVAAHACPCDQSAARRILHHLKAQGRMPWHDLQFRNRRGRMYPARLGRLAKISLPMTPGTGYAGLRVVIVLHEAAHIYDHATGGRGHSPSFWKHLRRLVESDWRKHLSPAINLREIYDRHPGLYALVITRQQGKKQFCETLVGPFNGPEAHAKAVRLVTEKGDCLEAFPYSNKEGQFIGAIYQRGHEYLDWQSGGGVDVADPGEEGTLLSQGTEPVRQVGSPEQSGIDAGTDRARTLHRMPASKGSKLHAVEGLKPWPKSPAAQLVRQRLGQQPMTVAEFVETCGPELKTLGVAFPASLVSRLKQAGLLEPYEGDI